MVTTPQFVASVNCVILSYILEMKMLIKFNEITVNIRKLLILLISPVTIREYQVRCNEIHASVFFVYYLSQVWRCLVHAASQLCEHSRRNFPKLWHTVTQPLSSSSCVSVCSFHCRSKFLKTFTRDKYNCLVGFDIVLFSDLTETHIRT